MEPVTSCFALKVDFAIIAQLVTAFAAVLALVLSPWLAFNASRRLAVAQSRQQWLDALRADIAELISLHETIVSARTAAQGMRMTPLPDQSQQMHQIGVLRVKVRARLSMGNPLHKALHVAISTFIVTYDQNSPDYSAGKIIKALDPITDEVWDDIKKAKI
jgi:hypothetical protein